MGRVETEEFSLSTGELFELVTVTAGSVSFRNRSAVTFAPQMSVWTGDPDDAMTPEERLSDMLRDTLLAERRRVNLAGMDGEWSRVDDRLKDYETGETRSWHRLRVLLVAADGSTWYHATAMADGQDLLSVQSELEKVLDTIVVRVTGDEARKARAQAESEVDEIFARMAEQARAIGDEQGAEKPVVPKAAPPAKDIEATFDAVVASTGVADRRDALRRIALPILTLTEAGESNFERLGQSRVAGGPDLPEDVEWPRDRSGRHLNFLAQIDLADLPDRYDDVPANGLLSFFSGTDLTDGTVLYTPAGTFLVSHDLSEDAEETAIAGARMVRWDSDAARFVADGATVGDLSIDTDRSGRMTFLRHGEPVVVLASEYEISSSPQCFRFDRSLSVPFGISGNVPQAYLDAGLEDPSDFAIALGDAFAIGDGPQHQMFGVTGVRELAGLQARAADHARTSGWHDLAALEDWFLLFKIASGGEAGFSFGDHGNLIFMANRLDTAKTDFTRVYAFVESG